MKLAILTPLSAALSILATGVLAPVAAQEYGEEQEPQRRGQEDQEMRRQETQKGPHHIVLADLLSAEVVLTSGEVSTANPDEDEARPRGEVEDLIINLSTGEVSWAVIGVGGILDVGDRPVAVPTSAIACEPKGKHSARVTLDVTPETLKKLPEFPIDEAREKGLATTIKTVEASWTAVVEKGGDAEDARPERETERGARGEEDVVVRGAAVAAKPVANLCATQLDDWNVRAANGEFGSISKAFLNIDEVPKLHFVVVSTGGVAGIGATEYLVPFQALNVTQADGDEWAWTLPKTEQEMKDAPKYTEPEDGMLDKEQCRKAAEFFGIEMDAHRGKMKEKKEQGDDYGSKTLRRRR